MPKPSSPSFRILSVGRTAARMNAQPEATATIMVVQDEFLLRMATAADLRERGYRVIEAFGADDARRALDARDPIALVVLDITMAGEMTGFALARWILAHHPQTKVLVTAAVNPDGDDIPILNKPFRPV